MKKKVISLLLCLVMALSLIPTVAFAKDDDQGPHIDIDVNMTIMVNGKEQQLKLTNADLNNITITNSKNETFTLGNGFTDGGTSSDNKGNSQLRLKGNFDYGTQNEPVTYTVTLRKTIDNVVFEFVVSSDKWAANNVCPGNGDSKGIDVKFGTGSTVEGMLQLTKNIVIDEAALVKDKEFTFTITGADSNNSNFTKTISMKTKGTEKVLSTVVNLPAGNYSIVETSSSTYEGYKAATVSYSPANQTSAGSLVTISVGQRTDVTVTNTYEKVATPTGSLTIVKKIDCNKTGADDNTTFTFQVKKGNEVIGDVVSVEVKVSKTSGQTVVNLPVGDYTVEEISPSVPRPVSAHKYSGTTYDYGKDANGEAATYATVTADNNSTATVTVTNIYEPVYGEPIYNPATLTITKVDKEDPTKKLTGAEFTLTKGETKLTSTDNENGTYTFSDIKGEENTGEWTLTETKAPEGYQKSSQTWTVYVNSDSSTTIPDGNVYVVTYTYLISIGSKEYFGGDAWKKDQVMTITNEKEPEPYTVEIPVTKTVSAKAGSTLPKNLPSFTFKAYLGETKVGTLTLALNKETKVSGAQNQYQGTLKANIPAAAFANNNMVTLTIKEDKGIDTKWKYDTNFYTVDVTLTDDGEIGYSAMLNGEGDPLNGGITFENTYSYKYTPAPKPVTPTTVTSVKTGDMGVALYAGLAILSMTGSAGVILRRRKNDK